MFLVFVRMLILGILFINIDYAINLVKTSSPIIEPRGHIYKDLNYLLKKITNKRNRLQRIYIEQPEFLKEEKIKQARVDYYFALMIYQKAQLRVSKYKRLYKKDSLTVTIRVLAEKIEKHFKELKIYATYIKKMHPLDLYARNYALKPGKLLEFRKFKNLKTQKMMSGKDLFEILKRAYKFFNLRTKTSLNLCVKLLKPIADNVPKYLPAKFWLAKTYFDLEKIEEAQQLMYELLSIDPDLIISKSIDDRMLREDDLINYQYTPENKLPHEIASPVQVKKIKLDKSGMRSVPFVVSLGNSRRARPQSGLSNAELVLEMPVEGGITRLIAYFGKNSDMSLPIGPVRSMRNYFLREVYHLRPFFIHCGGSPGSYREKLELDFFTVDEIGGYMGFFRDRKQKPPHNLYTSLDKMAELAYSKHIKIGSPLKHLKTSKIGYPYKGKLIKAIHITYFEKYIVTHQFDVLTQNYVRYVNGVLLLDPATQRPSFSKNIIIQYVNVDTIDSVGRKHVDILGSGKAEIFIEGKRLKAKWKKIGLDSKTFYTDESNKEISLFHGNTWIHFVPNNKRIRVDNFSKIN
ncbi:MAG: hypothetical protein COB02_13440 [Candidatus Cloacimonadota bacterium]|nr:MAG: hypothetical protein COB02_13440 [Candidatus Cloacimonadota bacterium]